MPGNIDFAGYTQAILYGNVHLKIRVANRLARTANAGR